MIRRISGTVVDIETLGIVVDVSGWGALVFVPHTDAYAIGDTVSLYTYLAVKQDGIDLYGFSTTEDRHFFELCLTVSGIGPKTALSLLKRAPREHIEEALQKRDISYLTRIVGLSKKSAEKIAVEIGEKIQGGGAISSDDIEVFETLVALGYTEREARSAVTALPKDIEGKDARLKAALSKK